MGSPLSAVTACLFMEVLEKEHYSKVISSDSKWYRYVDDCLIVTHRDTDIEAVLCRMNNIHNKIQFTVESENNGSLPFLDAVIIRTENSVKFKVYRKPTNKDDLIHYHSAHDEKTKSGVIIGFYLRAFRICSPEYINEEIIYINHTFEKLGYPKGVLAASLKKAESIRRRKKAEEKVNIRYLVVPSSSLANTLGNALRPTGLVVVCDPGKKIGEIVKYKDKKDINETSIVYKIPCNGCDSAYYGESHRGLEKRIKEHRADVRYHRLTNALVTHIDDKGHLPKWEQAEVLEKGLSKQQRKVIEALYITINNNINQRTGDIKWTSNTATFAAAERATRRTNQGPTPRTIGRDPG